MRLADLTKTVVNLAVHFVTRRQVGHTSALLHGIAKSDKPALIIAGSLLESVQLQGKVPVNSRTTTASLGQVGQGVLDAHAGPVLLDNSALAHLLSECGSFLTRHSQAEFALDCIQATLANLPEDMEAKDLRDTIARAAKAIEDYRNPAASLPLPEPATPETQPA